MSPEAGPAPASVVSGVWSSRQSGGVPYNGRMLPESTFLANQLLIAVPSLADPTFSRTVALICRHDADGAMGLVLNRPSEYTLGDVLDQMGLSLIHI